MKIQKLKDHVAVELSGGEKISELGYKYINKSVLDGKFSHALPMKRILKNGQDRILFSTSGEKYISEIEDDLDDDFVEIFEKALNDTITYVSSNSFLQKEDICLDKNVIFIDDSGDFKFLLIPYGKCHAQSDDEFQNTVNDVLKYIKSKNSNKIIKNTNINEIDISYKGMYGSISFYIVNDNFIIGKDAACNGVISANNAVSRKHCRIFKEEGAYYVEDLHSSNHTYVNGKEVLQATILNNGDVIRVADMDFNVSLSEENI